MTRSDVNGQRMCLHVTAFGRFMRSSLTFPWETSSRGLYHVKKEAKAYHVLQGTHAFANDIFLSFVTLSDKEMLSKTRTQMLLIYTV